MIERLPVDLSAEALAEMVAVEGIHPDPTVVELTRTLIDLTEREKRARLALIAIRDVTTRSTGRPYTALSQIDQIARKGLA